MNWRYYRDRHPDYSVSGPPMLPAPMPQPRRMIVYGPPNEESNAGPSVEALQQRIDQLEQENADLKAALDKKNEPSTLEKIVNHPLLSNPIAIAGLSAVATGLGTWFISRRQTKSKIDELLEVAEERHRAELKAAKVGPEELAREKEKTQLVMEAIRSQ